MTVGNSEASVLERVLRSLARPRSARRQLVVSDATRAELAITKVLRATCSAAGCTSCQRHGPCGQPSAGCLSLDGTAFAQDDAASARKQWGRSPTRRGPGSPSSPL